MRPFLSDKINIKSGLIDRSNRVHYLDIIFDKKLTTT